MTQHIEIVSNASLLNPNLNRELVAAGLNRIRISIEGLGAENYFNMTGVKIDWKQFVDNIRDLYEHKGDLEIYIKTVDSAVQTKEEKEVFLNTFGDICDKIFIEHVIPFWANYDEINADFTIEHAEGLHGHTIREVNICPTPFYSCIIQSDGEVNVCCSDWERKISMGNVNTESFYDIWNGEKYHKFLAGMVEKGYRENHPLGCGRCEAPKFDAVDNMDVHRELLLEKFCNK